VEHACAHVGKLAQLGIGDNADSLGILNDTGVSHQESAYVCPVLVEVHLRSLCDNGAGEVGAAAGEGLDGAVGHRAVESGNNRLGSLVEKRAQACVGDVGVEVALVVEEDGARSVNELIAEVICQHDTVQVLAAAGSVIASDSSAEVLADLREFLVQAEGKSQVGDDTVVALPDGCEGFRKILALNRYLIIAAVQHIGDLGVLLEALSGRGGNDVTSFGVGVNYISDLLKLLCVGERASAELYNLAHSVDPFLICINIVVFIYTYIFYHITFSVELQ
jgi:hypothetical protein